MLSTELQEAINECRTELGKAEHENIKIKGDVRIVEQHLFKAKKILQNVLPPMDP